jgi:hypothetical protein
MDLRMSSGKAGAGRGRGGLASIRVDGSGGAV